jgi:glutaredoxin
MNIRYKNIKMENIKIYTLEHCTYCNELKQKLQQHGLTYSEYNISNNNLLGNQIEFLWKCERYPMVLIGEDTLLLPESKSNASNITLYNNISELINLILKYK